MSTSNQTKAQDSVQHRSDQLMKEQLQNVHQAQHDFQLTLQNLSTATSTQEIDRMRLRAAKLRSSSQNLVLSFQVMGKINSELSHARADLTNVLQTGNGDIHIARKRVMWLDNKIRKVYDRTAPNSINDVTHHKENEDKDRPAENKDKEEIEKSLEDEEKTDKESGEGSNYLYYQEPALLFSDLHSDTSARLATSININKLKKKTTDDVLVKGKEDFKIERESGNFSKTDYEHIQNEENKGCKETFVTGVEALTFMTNTIIRHPDQQHKHSSTQQHEQSSVWQNEHSSIQQHEHSTTQQHEHSTIQQHEHSTTQQHEHSTIQQHEQSSIQQHEHSSTQQHKHSTIQQHELSTIQQHEQFSIQQCEQTSIQQCEHTSTQQHDTETKGLDCWQSEPHRFEYSELADILTTCNPLSYHQVGLAICTSFVQKVNTIRDCQELPWRLNKEGSNMRDINSAALDKLTGYVYGLYDQVYHAAMVSIPFKSQQVPQSTDNMNRLPVAALSDLDSARKNNKRVFCQLDEKNIRQKRVINKQIVFYPKPVPTSQVLPISRISMNKEYPLCARSFYKPNRNVGKPAERLVDQGNLLAQTKLVLYSDRVKLPICNEKILCGGTPHEMIQNNTCKTITLSNIESKRETKKVHVADLKGDNDLNSWDQLKLTSKESADLRLKRVKMIVNINLQSSRVEDRIDGTVQLGILKCGDSLVIDALKEHLRHDSADRVKYEATKSLILIGCWEDEVIQKIVKYLIQRNQQVRQDLTNTMIQGKNLESVNKTTFALLDLVKVLSHFCCIPDPCDLVALNSAIFLSFLHMEDCHVLKRLITAIEVLKDSHMRIKVLEVLVKQLHYLNLDIIRGLLSILKSSPMWKDRLLTCHLLGSCGSTEVYMQKSQEQIFEGLETCLWTDPNSNVRSAATDALTALGMFENACGKVLRKCGDSSEDVRAQAVVTAGTLKMRSEKMISLLLDMLKLDTSDYVRLMIIRTFAALKLRDKRVLRCLKDTTRLGGALARESSRVLKMLCQTVVT